MGERWSTERVTALAPDSASEVAGRRLATPVPWSDIGWSHPLLWGSCQGSGRTPYSVAIDVSGPTYRCSCPSHKFPCKHVLGLLYLWAEGRIDEGGSISRFALEWSTKQEKGTEKPVREGPAEKTEEQLAAAAARAEQREERVTLGLAELERWLADQVTAGLAHTRPGALRDLAARMVDAQAPGVAGRLRDLDRTGIATRQARGPRGSALWLDQTVAEYGLLHLLARAWTQPDLPEALRATVRSHLGFTVPKESVLATPPVTDTWAVVGMRDSDEEQVSTRRVWLYGTATGRWALVLFFTPRGMQADASLVPGSAVTADLHFYPGGPTLRAMVGTTHKTHLHAELVPPQATVADALATWRGVLAEDPWLGSYPVAVHGRVVLAPQPGIVDDEGGSLALVASSPELILALTGGDAVTLLGEITPSGLLATSYVSGGELVIL